MELMQSLRLYPNRKKQLSEAGIPVLVGLALIAFGLINVLGWLEPATRIQRTSSWAIVALSPFLLFRIGEQLFRPSATVRNSGISWWTFDRKSGRIPANQIVGLAICSDEHSQSLHIRAADATELQIEIQAIGDPEGFVKASTELLGIEAATE